MPAKRILVVDDEEILRLMIQDVLALDGHAIVVASSGEEALEQLRSQPFDLVLTDNNMPGIEGLELLRLVREEFPDLPVILMTGYGSLQVSIRAHDYGASGYLLKPFEDITAISREVGQVLARREREQSFKQKIVR